MRTLKNCHTRVNKSKRHLGFTLIELLITIAIIGILSAIAFPQYTQYIERSRRNDAKAVLVEAAQYAERKYTENRNYANITLPAPLTRSPKDASSAAKILYDITITPTNNSNGYVVSAAPRTGVGPKCGAISINQFGIKTQQNGSAEVCWTQ
jgi:type IV pilus assembly protein PilE